MNCCGRPENVNIAMYLMNVRFLFALSMVLLAAGFVPARASSLLPLGYGASADDRVYAFETHPADKVGTRLRWTIPFKGDLSACDGLEFDFKVENRERISDFGLFVFHDNRGSHSTKFSVDAETGWSHIVIRKRLLYNSENHPDGWNKIDHVMVLARVVAEGTVRAWVRNIQSLPSPSSAVAIVYAEKADDDNEDLKKGAYGVQGRLAYALDDLGVASYFLSSRDFARGLPANVRLLMLCGRDPLPVGAVTALADYLACGGRVISWTSLGPQLQDLYKKHRDRFVCQGNLKDRNCDLRALLRSPVLAAAPEFVSAIESQTRLREERNRRREAAIAKMSAPAESHRSITCHHPWGKPGYMNWTVNAENLRKGGFTHLSLCVCRGIYASYASEVLRPWPGYEANGGDALVAAKAACDRAGLKLTAWRCCWITPEWLMTSEDLAQMKAEWRMAVDREGKTNDRFSCPTHPENVRQEIESLVELAHKGVEGVDLDFIRYMSTEFCYCERCRALFEKRIGRKIEDWPEAISADLALEAAWIDFRTDNISHVVEQVSSRVRHECPDVKIRVYGYDDPIDARKRVGQDWPLWGRMGWIDAVSMMDYCDSPADFKILITRQKSIDCGDIVRYPIIGMTCWPDTGEDAWKTAQQIGILRACGYSGFGIFDFGLRTERIRETLSRGPLRP